MIKVSCITPSTRDRAHFNERIKQIFDSQDYPEKEHLLWLNDGTIGSKRNKCIEAAQGEIILHMDSDDLYAPDWISKSVEALVNSKASLIGLRTAYFLQPGKQLWEYRYNAGQPYAIGATFCYWRYMWENNKFRDISEGDDLYFLGNAGIIKNHDYQTGFTAIIHGANTCSHKAIEMRVKEIRAISYNMAPQIANEYYPTPLQVRPAV